MKLIQVAPLGDPCTDVHSCPKVLADVDEGVVYAQGTLVTDPEVLAEAKPGPGEVVVALPIDQLPQAARGIEEARR